MARLDIFNRQKNEGRNFDTALDGMREVSRIFGAEIATLGGNVTAIDSHEDTQKGYFPAIEVEACHVQEMLALLSQLNINAAPLREKFIPALLKENNRTLLLIKNYPRD